MGSAGEGVDQRLAFDNDGNPANVCTVELCPVPEPTTAALLGLGLLTLAR